jgi:hypothetical protein
VLKSRAKGRLPVHGAGLGHTLVQRSAVFTALLILSVVLAWSHWHPEGAFWGWELLGVPRMPPPDHPFTDTVSVTHSLDCFRAGFDPYLTGRCDPWGRMLNYPPVWLELRRLGVSSASTLVLGIGMATVTALALLLIFRTRSWPSFVIVLFTLLSPAILFGIERGNVDTLLFSILVFGLFASRTLREDIKQTLRAGLVIGLTILKAYPIAACLLFIDRTKWGWVTALGIGLAALAAFAWTSWDKLAFIYANTPLTSGYSFGSAPLLLDLAGQFASRDANRAHIRWLATGIGLGLGLSATAWVISSSRDLSRVLPPLVRGRFLDDLCLACLAIFCFCFLLGSNFNYRLIFLTGALPKLIEAYDAAHHRHLLIAPATVVALLWATRLPSIADYTLNWLIYGGACAWIADAVMGRGTGCSNHPRPELIAEQLARAADRVRDKSEGRL